MRSPNDALNKIVELLCAQAASGSEVLVTNGAGIDAVNIQDGGNSITVDGAVTATLSSTTRTATAIVTSAAGLTTAGARAVTFEVLTVTAVILGQTFAAGKIVNLSAPNNDTLAPIAYDATAGTLLIIEVN